MGPTELHVVSTIVIWSTWVAWLAYWAWSSRHVNRTVDRQSWTSRLTLVGALLVGVFVLPAILGERVDALVFSPSVWSAAIGSGLCLSGLALSIWARRTLGRNWSAMVTLKERHELVRSGPYRYVRHPIYTCVLTMGLGTCLLSGRVRAFMVLAMVLLAFLVKMRREERLLESHFGGAYIEYRKSVRALVPFVA